jgi:hypothetical protein
MMALLVLLTSVSRIYVGASGKQRRQRSCSEQLFPMVIGLVLKARISGRIRGGLSL